MPNSQLIHRVTFEMTHGTEAFVEAIRDVAARMKKEGRPGLLSYNFYVEPGQSHGEAVIVYENADALVENHDLIHGWPELAAVGAVSRVTGTSFLGPRAPKLDAWIEAKAFPFEPGKFGRHAAGFDR